MATYKTDIYEKTVNKKIITIINMTPQFSKEERKEIKKRIKLQLYDVFCKYV